jgi:hypothetical protein
MPLAVCLSIHQFIDFPSTLLDLSLMKQDVQNGGVCRAIFISTHRIRVRAREVHVHMSKSNRDPTTGQTNALATWYLILLDFTYARTLALVDVLGAGLPCHVMSGDL